ncbi:uncharacterized protein LOC135385127 [Ornithodoros turicata]|uniref:uncharacterized protein LOC135385127 n=1 Tax=Ornithodoros turicata TaxID=34597 RepID=UPI00313958DD
MRLVIWKLLNIEMHIFVAIVNVLMLFDYGATANEIVYPSLVEGRDSNGIKVVRINDDLTLNLRRSDFLGSELITSYWKDGELHHDAVNSAIFGLHDDPEHFSAVLLHELQRGVQLRGLLTPSLYIEPLYTMERSDAGRMAHKIYKVREQSPIGTGWTAGVEVSERSYRWGPHGPQLPVTVPIDVGVVCTTRHRAEFKTDRAHITYVVVFMRSVSLRFTAFIPRIKFRLVGLHVALENETQYLLGSGNIVVSEVNNPNFIQVDGEWTLERLRGFFNQSATESTPNPHIVYLITKEHLIMDWEEKIFVPGMAFPGGICTDYNVGMGWDDAKYYLGIEIAVRMMAHLLGAPFDNVTEGCEWNKGYIMGNYTVLTINMYKFSDCSMKGMMETLRRRLLTSFKLKENKSLDTDESGETICFESPYSSMESISDKLPGQTVDENEFCKYLMQARDDKYVFLCGVSKYLCVQSRFAGIWKGYLLLRRKRERLASHCYATQPRRTQNGGFAPRFGTVYHQRHHGGDSWGEPRGVWPYKMVHKRGRRQGGSIRKDVVGITSL